MIVYHYTKLKKWKDIQAGSWQSKNKPGLGALRKLGTDYNKASEKSGVFALTEPIPDSWINNTQFPNVWNRLKNNIGKLLLEISIDPKKAMVYDWAEKEKNDEDNSTEFAEKQYINSGMSLEDYLVNKNLFVLPEVVIEEDVPIENIKISDEQPLLEEKLEICKGTELEILKKEIQSIPELTEWYKNYEARKEREIGERIGPKKI